MSDLRYVSQMAVGSQLQALPLRPGLDGGQPLTQCGPPVVRAQARRAGFWCHELIKQPSADEVEELREELDGEGRVDVAPAQKRHGVHQGVQHHLCGQTEIRHDIVRSVESVELSSLINFCFKTCLCRPGERRVAQDQ